MEFAGTRKKIDATVHLVCTDNSVIEGRFILGIAGPISDFFAQSCSSMCRLQDWAKKIIFVSANVQINPPPIVEELKGCVVDFAS